LLASFSVPDLGIAFAGGAVARVLRFTLPLRRCTMVTIKVTRKRERNATRSLGLSMGCISGAENGLGFSHKSRSSDLLSGYYDMMEWCRCYRPDFSSENKTISEDVQEHLVSICC